MKIILSTWNLVSGGFNKTNLVTIRCPRSPGLAVCPVQMHRTTRLGALRQNPTVLQLQSEPLSAVNHGT